MKRLLICLFVALLPLLNPDKALAWGREGHAAIAELAERHLTPRARERIERYLEGHSIVFYAKWMDDYRHTPEYGFTTYWHMAPVNRELHYVDSLLTPRGNVVQALEEVIARLRRYRTLDDSTVCVNLKYIVHMVADMHCPSHIEYATHDANYRVWVADGKHKPSCVKAHHVWDSDVIWACCDLDPKAWAGSLDTFSRRERRAAARGSVREWFHDCAVSCEVQFEWVRPESRLERPFFEKAFPLVESQVRKAGYRLAAILNELFD